MNRSITTEEELMNKGGLAMITMLEKTVEAKFMQNYANRADEEAREATLDALGW